MTGTDTKTSEAGSKQPTGVVPKTSFGPKTCEVCRITFAPTGSRQKFCTGCTPKKRRKRKRAKRAQPKRAQPKRDLLEWDGRSLTAPRWAEEPEVKALGITATMIRKRRSLGWSVERTLTSARMVSGARTRPAVYVPSIVVSRHAPTAATTASPIASAAATPTSVAHPDPRALAAIELLTERIEDLEDQLGPMRGAVNVMAELAGLAKPYPGVPDGA